MGAVVLLIGIFMMILLHEAAHFAAAKSVGMKVSEFFVGFGPRIWSTRRGETEYGIKAVPLGGYVRILGMSMFEEIEPEDRGRTYRDKPFWAKSLVVLAGPASHFVVAFLIFFVVFAVVGVTTPTTTVVELTTNPNGSASPAQLAGVQVGDRLVSVDGEELETWGDFVEAVQGRPGETVTVTVERDGTLVPITVTLASRVVNGVETGYFGVARGEEVEREGIISGAGHAISEVGFVTKASAQGLWELVRGFPRLLGAAVGQNDDVLDEVRPLSPIGVAQLGQAAQRAGGLVNTLGILALVNVFVALFNLLPVYPFDGGHFVVAAWEKVTGSEVDQRKLVPVAALVVFFFITLGLLGFYFDLVRPVELPF
jgi:membrane-associated protease RseP (regulator of RpoE activity)